MGQSRNVYGMTTSETYLSKQSLNWGKTMTDVSKIVESVLKEYLILFNKHLPDTIEGLYLHGSIALNAYMHESSDIDFITVTNRRLTEQDSDTLTYIHKTLEEIYPKPEMDGVYIVKEDMGKTESNSSDNLVNPYYNNGEVHVREYFNFNPITWYLFKHKGIKVIGQETTSYKIELSSQEMCMYVLDNMNSYWAGRLQWIENSIDDVKEYSSIMIDKEVEWSVLGILRQYYTLKELDITSKQGAGEYGLENLPECWHRIIREAMNIRSGFQGRNFTSEVERINYTIGLLKYIIHHCNELKIASE